VRYAVCFKYQGHDEYDWISTWKDYNEAREYCDDAMRVPPSKHVTLPGCYCICRGGEIANYKIMGIYQ
jgi:hypothetical protein